MFPLAALVAGDPVRGYQESRKRQQSVDTGDVDAQGQAAAGNAYMGLFGPQQTPGQPPAGAQPQQPPNMLAQLLQRLRGGASPPPGGPPPAGAMPSSGPQQGAAPQPSAGMPGMPPQGAVPGAQPMPGAQPPMSGGAPMGGPPTEPMGQQGLPTGQQLDWRTIVQQVIRSNPGVKDPRVIAAAVDRFMPLMSQQTQQQWREMSMILKQGQLDLQEERQRTQAGLGERRLDLNEAQLQQRDQQFQAREDRLRERERQIEERARLLEEGRNWRAQLSADTRTALQGMSLGARKEIAAFMEEGRDKRAELSAGTRKEIAQLGADSRSEIQRMLEQGRTTRATTAEEGRTRRFEEGEAGRTTRFEEGQAGADRRAALSAGTRTAIAQLNAAARKELQEYLEGGRVIRFEQGQTSREAQAQLSANTRKEIAKLSTDQRRELQMALEAGRTQRFREGEAGRQGRYELGQGGLDTRFERAEAGRESRFERSEAGRQERFDTTQSYRATESILRQDRQHEMLSMQRQRLEQQITASKDRNQLGQWRALLDAQHKRAMEVIQSAAAGMDAKERKKLLDEENSFYNDQIEMMKNNMAQPTGGEPGTTVKTQSIPATAPKPGEVRGGYRFKGGDPSKQESWEAVK